MPVVMRLRQVDIFVLVGIYGCKNASDISFVCYKRYYSAKHKKYANIYDCYAERTFDVRCHWQQAAVHVVVAMYIVCWWWVWLC